MDSRDPKDIVRQGYNALSVHYSAAFSGSERYRPWIRQLLTELPAGSPVLDVGCGSGVPVAKELAGAGHLVTGVDISEVQIGRAREQVPAGEFHCTDATLLRLPAASFTAVVCLYMLIHVPLAEQPALVGSMARWLRPGGWLLAVTGRDACTAVDDNWLNGGASMWWQQADAATYREWITGAGLSVEREEFVPEGDVGHTLFWARQY